MGAVKTATYADLVVDAVGTASAVASGAVKQVAQTATSLVTSGALSGAVRFAGGAVARVNPYLALASGAYEAYQFLTKEEKAKLSEPELVAIQNEENIAKTLAQTGGKAKELGEKTKAIDDSVVYEQGQSLPSVLSQNAKALTQSVNTLTYTLNEQLSLLNSYMMANTIYQQQFLDIAVSDVNLKADSVTALNALPVSLFQLVEAIQGTGLSVPLEKVVEAIQGIGVIPSVDGLSVPLDKISSAVKGIGAISSISNALSAPLDKVSESIKELGSVSLSIDELVKLKSVDNEQVKEHYALRAGEIELNKEAMEYDKTAQSVKDLDGQTIASFAPREASLVKDVTLAKDTTDKINFSIEEDVNLDDVVDGIDISSIFGYSGDADGIKEFYSRLGGQGL